MSASSTITPSPTLYINNLNDKVNKDELRSQLLALFTTYGRVIDIVARKGSRMKGQAFVSFSDLAEATSAMRACEGFIFYDKPLRIRYAKSKSYVVRQREDPDFVPPNPVSAQSRLQNGSAAAASNGLEKRSREEEEDLVDSARQPKREKPSGDEDGEEMELEEDEETEQPAQPVPQVQEQPSARLLCTNLPMEVTDDVLGVLFQQYQGFISTHVVQASTPNAAGQKVKMAQVIYDSPELASVAKEALDGFALKKGWNMSVAYI